MILIIFLIHDPFHIILPDFTPFLLIEEQLSITSSYTSSPFNFITINCIPLPSLDIPFWTTFKLSKRLFNLLSVALKLFSLLYCSCYYTCSHSHQFNSYTTPCMCLSFLIFPPSPAHSTTMHLLPFCPHSRE